MTRRRRPGGDVDSDREHRLTVGAPRLLPMDAEHQHRAVAALAALLIPLVRDGMDAGAAKALDRAGDMERSSDHAEQ